MSCLPAQGASIASSCGYVTGFNRPAYVSDDKAWCIRWNPLAWGNVEPEILVLGFSKGPTQVCALEKPEYQHDRIAFMRSLPQVGKILAHIEVVCVPEDGDYGKMIYHHICNRNGRFHFGSLVRCAVERKDEKGGWKGGHGKLDEFLNSDFGKEVAGNCASQFLCKLPAKTKLVIVFGCDTDYIQAVRKLIQDTRGRKLNEMKEVAYTDGKVTFVHVVHFTAPYDEIPDWLGENDSNDEEKGRRGRLAKEVVKLALARK